MASTADPAVAATWPKLPDRHFVEVAVELGQVGVDPTMRPDASQLDGVLRTRACFLVLRRVLDTVVTLGYAACSACITAKPSASIQVNINGDEGKAQTRP